MCENVTLAVLAASIPPWVNETEQCHAHIYTTCDFHCLPHKPTNLTANTTLFPARELPRELRFLDIRPATHETFQGYHCTIEKCPELPEPCPYPNVTLVESGYMEDYVDPASGNVSIVPVMWNVSFSSYLGCKRNRSSTCLDTCHDFGYRVCFPGEDPFDTCVQACVANKTYEPPLPEFDHDVAACTKALRLTPSVEERKGAAWHKHKQRVQAGFNTTFTFKLGYPSERCAGAGTGADAGVGAEAGADAAMAAGALLPGTAPGGEPGGELGGEPALSTAPRSTRGARRVGIGEQGASGDGGDACVASLQAHVGAWQLPIWPKTYLIYPHQL